MWRIPVTDVISLSFVKHQLSAIFQLDVELASEAENHVALRAAMIGHITRRVFHHPDADVAKVLGPPLRKSGLAGMMVRFQSSP